MSISDNYAPVKQVGDGSTVQFSGNWNVLNSSFIRVYLENVSTGIQVLQTLGADFTLTFNDSGFIVDFTVGTTPPATEYVVVAREVSIDQSTPYKTSKGFQGKVQEDSFDKLTAIVQDLKDDVDRAPKTPIGGDPLVFPTYSAGLNIGWSASVDGEIVNAVKTISEIDAAVDAVAALAAGSGIIVSGNDTTVGDLESKLLVGDGLTLSTQNDGGNETRTIEQDYASQAEAEAGTATDKPLNALRTKQAVEANGGSLVAISSVTASASSSVDFTSGIDGTYDEYVIRGISVRPVNNYAPILMRTSSDSGVSFDNSGTDYAVAMTGINSNASAISLTVSLQSEINITNNGADSSYQSSDFEVNIRAPSDAALYTKCLVVSGFDTGSSDHIATISGVGHRRSAGIVNGVQFKMATGNIASGTFTLYGVSKA